MALHPTGLSPVTHAARVHIRTRRLCPLLYAYAFKPVVFDHWQPSDTAKREQSRKDKDSNGRSGGAIASVTSPTCALRHNDAGIFPIDGDLPESLRLKAGVGLTTEAIASPDRLLLSFRD